MHNHQRVLRFVVRGQRLTKSEYCNFKNIVAGSANYLRANFTFTQREWGGCKKAASFWLNDQEYAVLLDETNSCDIPAEVLVGDRFFVSVMGKSNTHTITTNKVKVKQEVN